LPRLTVILVALVAAVAFAIPAAASAEAIFIVNSTGDEPDVSSADPLCSTSKGVCTLRAAIEASNAVGGPENLITFSPSFDGKASSTISPATPLPAITSTAVVAGQECPHGSELGPCVGVDGPIGQPVLKVQANNSAVYNLSITGGSNGIEVSDTEDFVSGNWIGIRLDGSTATNSGSGILATPGGPSAVIGANQIQAGSSGTGIQTQASDGEIFENEIGGAFNGILVSGGGNLIEGNSVLTSGNSSLSITGNGNEVFGNEFNGSNFSTIFIKGSATENRIGGDTPASENFFVDSEYSPIAMITTEATQNEVARNRGEANGFGSGFIFINKAAGAEPNFPNGGIGPPPIVTALQSTSTGSAEPGAKVRVFRLAPESQSNVEAFLGEVVADGSGNWKVTYSAQISVGAVIAASQTNVDGGTSEFASATSAADPAEEKEAEGPKAPAPCTAAGSTATGCGNEPPRPNVAPETTIAKKPKLNGTPTAKFKFTSSISGSSFECKLDKGKFKKCRSPKAYKKLKPGKHVFKVRAVSPAGLADPSPATKKFTVKPS
jgi:CSLREA domain-containing protein